MRMVPIKRLHLVADEVPWPPDYGAAMDMYYRMQALKDAGVKLHFHCFHEQREPTRALDDLCEAVHFYPVKPIQSSISLKLPYQLKARSSNALRKKLLADDAPVLFEGLRSCYYLSLPELEGRMKMVRTSLLEWEYFLHMARMKSGGFYPWLFNRESALMNFIQQTLQFADVVFSISEKDRESRPQDLRFEELAAFHPYSTLISQPGQGEYCLYHGDLGDPLNHEAAMFLVQEVFAGYHIPLVIAGARPQPDLIAAISRESNVTLVANPAAAEMEALQVSAQMHVLPSLRSVTFPYKLLISLFTGRHVVVSPLLVHRSGLDFGCVVADTAEEMRATVGRLFYLPFTESERTQRASLLLPAYNNAHGAKQILNWMERKPNISGES